MSSKKIYSVQGGVDGVRIFHWHDHWHADKALYPKYGYRIIYDAASRFQEKLDSVRSRIFIVNYAH